MLASQLMDMRAMLHSQGVIFAYSGYVTEPVLSGVGEALKQKLTIDDADTKSSRPSGWNSAPSSPFIRDPRGGRRLQGPARLAETRQG
jgi:hypothetical protein